MPASTAAAEPVAVVLTTAVGEPLAVEVIVSPSVNTVAVLFVPVLLYLTNNVSGSVPSVAETFTTSATTPEEPPVIVVFKYVFKEAADLDVNLTA